MKTIKEITDPHVKKFAKEVGERVRIARKRLKLSQKELAIKAKVSLTTINRLEKGKQTPHQSNYSDIAKALGVSISDLFSLKTETEQVGMGNPAELALAIIARVPTLDHAQLVLTLEYIEDLVASAPAADLLSQDRFIK